MQRRDRRTKPHQTASRYQLTGWAAVKTNTYTEHALYPKKQLLQVASQSGLGTADAALEFGRFRVLLRRRQLLADGLPVELGTRAFDLLLVLLEADGSLVSKEELLRQVWPGIVVSEENLKVQVSALRKALGDDRDVIHTEFGRGYRFTALLRSIAELKGHQHPTRPKLPSGPTLFQQNCRQSHRGSLGLN